MILFRIIKKKKFKKIYLTACGTRLHEYVYIYMSFLPMINGFHHLPSFRIFFFFFFAGLLAYIQIILFTVQYSTLPHNKIFLK